ncbi:DUF38 domain-containing protein [Caenorhabditis elegans]|uniref:DUF38 domain-containing protein n=1 Tax=Caenorhabditis elegans TaxID=6239 RepID=Q9XU26_CAEEL|nr:DUF38 domain-containing protein [Caenorhabditis elegans]CAB07210.3 DUF38 domain-containing protein [Caenorhabditis elegans]|eukprot:NP_507395.3 F-box A protein [Caenorhabditis elegans]
MASEIPSSQLSQILSAILSKLQTARDVSLLIKIEQNEIKISFYAKATGITFAELISRGTPNGCFIKWDDIEELADGREFFETSVAHLEIILESWPQRISVLSIYSGQGAEEIKENILRTHELFLYNFGEMLKSRKFLLKVAAFDVILWKEPLNNHLSTIMSCLDPRFLVTIVLSSSDEGARVDCEQLVNMEQWKSARRIKMDGIEVTMSIRDFLRFDEAITTLHTITSDDLVLLKDHFIHNQNPKSLTLNFQNFVSSDQNNEDQAHEVLGTCDEIKYVNGKLSSKKWRFLIERSHFSIEYFQIEFKNSQFKFSRL